MELSAILVEEVLEARIGQLDYYCVCDVSFLCQNNCHLILSNLFIKLVWF